MAWVPSVLLLLVALGVLLLALVLVVQCILAALCRRMSAGEPGMDCPPVAVLIPAYNEEQSIGTIIRSVLPQLGPGDRLLVVADHCSDRTVEVAQAAGGSVIEWDGPLPRGKAHALNYGLDRLAAEPPDVVVMIDADCVAWPGAVRKLAKVASVSGRPVQARNIVEPASASDLMSQVSAFAFMVNTAVRSSGLACLGLPCRLMGTGMAFPWQVSRRKPLIGGHLVEDLQLGIDLALSGYPPVYCHNAVVSSKLPAQPKAAWLERQRWEHGHLQILSTQVPRLLRGAIRQRRWDLVGMALDLAIPPLSLLLLLAVGGLSTSVLAGSLGASWLPAGFLSVSIILILAAILAAWLKFGRALFPLRVLLAAPVYVVRKIPLYHAFLSAPQRSWEERTERDADL